MPLSSLLRTIASSAQGDQSAGGVPHLEIDDAETPARAPDIVAQRRPQIVDAQVDGRDAVTQHGNQGKVAGDIDQTGDDAAVELPRSRGALYLGSVRCADHECLGRRVEGL